MVVVVIACAAACGPRLTDSPTEYHGDATARMGTLCSSDSIRRGEQREFWVKFHTLHDTSWSVDWRGGVLSLTNAEVVRKAAGRPSHRADGLWERFETYWVQTPKEAPLGSEVVVGPLLYTMNAKKGGTRAVQGVACTARVTE